MLGGITDKAICTHGDNKDLFQKDLNGAIICLPQTIGSTTGGYVLMGVAKLGVAPRAMLFANHVDSHALGGLLMADIWMEKHIITVDLPGDEFLAAVNTGDPIAVHEDGTVDVGQAWRSD